MTNIIKAGRPTKDRDSFVRDAYKLSLLGLIDKQLAFFFCISESTLYRSALGFSYEESVIKEFNGLVEVIKTTKHRPPNLMAMIFWLRNRQPYKWSNNPLPKDNELAATPVQIVVNVEDARKESLEH